MTETVETGLMGILRKTEDDKASAPPPIDSRYSIKDLVVRDSMDLPVRRCEHGFLCWPESQCYECLEHYYYDQWQSLQKA